MSRLLLWCLAGMGSEGRRCWAAAQRPWVGNARKISESEQPCEQPHQQTGARTPGEALGKAIFASSGRPPTGKFTAPCAVKEGWHGWLDPSRESSSLSFHKGHGDGSAHGGDLSRRDEAVHGGLVLRAALVAAIRRTANDGGYRSVARNAGLERKPRGFGRSPSAVEVLSCPFYSRSRSRSGSRFQPHKGESQKAAAHSRRWSGARDAALGPADATMGKYLRGLSRAFAA